MSRPKTFEQHKLQDSENYIASLAKGYEDRLALLECVAAKVSGLNIEEYWEYYVIESKDNIIEQSQVLLDLLYESNVPIPYAISSLAREPISVDEQKKNGAFYTDYRLAEALRCDCAPYINQDVRVIDFAAGTGILLAGVAQEYKLKFNDSFDEWLANNLFACDLSAVALRGATAAFISLTADVETIIRMRRNWETCDSLIDDIFDHKSFDIVIGNPPWGKIKISRHSYSKLMGENRVYGEEFNSFDNDEYYSEKNALLEYSRIIKNKYDLLGNAEPDMYMAFIQKAILSLKPGGHLCLLVPAGLIRSQGTIKLRERLINQGSRLEYYLFDNKGGFFSIDSRFKFLILSFDQKNEENPLYSFLFRKCWAKNELLSYGSPVTFSISELSKIREDLTVPEVTSEREKELFFKLHENADFLSSDEGQWKAEIYREVDMTNDRKAFLRNPGKNSIPVVEGRMVQQYRYGAKSYVSGSGRSAVWNKCIGGGNPQFYYPTSMLNDKLLTRTASKRVGFCDIAGQTNERAMMCTVIPENVVCGNKVPTIVFPNDSTNDRLYLWTGIANSFVFDWLVRRIISTTINYFLLLSIPIPKMDIASECAKTIISNAKALSEMGEEYYNNGKMELLRACIEANVANAYGLTLEDFEIIMNDFPILDRRQPALEGEKKSTVSRDAVLSEFEKMHKLENKKYTTRYDEEKRLGAVAFIPSEMADLITRSKKDE